MRIVRAILRHSCILPKRANAADKADEYRSENATSQRKSGLRCNIVGAVTADIIAARVAKHALAVPS